MAHSASHDPAPGAKRLAWLAGALCVLCCTVPLIGVAIGSAALAGTAVYLEQAAIGFLAAAVAMFGVWLYRRRKGTASAAAPACDLDCGCKTHHQLGR